MAHITFKAKTRQAWRSDLSGVEYFFVSVPKLTRSHCDMSAFRNHPTYGIVANSDLFSNALKRIRADVFKGRDYMRLDQVPEGVIVDTTGFLTKVTINV